MKAFIVNALVTGLMLAGSAMATDMPELAKNHKCILCHSIDKKIVGPAWMDVSRRYKGVTSYTYNNKEYPLEQGLLMKVSKGGPGNWGTMPMIGNDLKSESQDDLKKLVKFILKLSA
jgi:cytochrome c